MKSNEKTHETREGMFEVGYFVLVNFDYFVEQIFKSLKVIIICHSVRPRFGNELLLLLRLRNDVINYIRRHDALSRILRNMVYRQAHSIPLQCIR